MNGEPLPISGIQHFAFCPRQWALIHLEQQWQDNERTASGHIFHSRAHDGPEHEMRGDVLILRGLRVFSDTLQVSGICDVVEFFKDPNGVVLPGYAGAWIPYPVEYKRGEPKAGNADRLQLCAQALCLEEMLLCDVREGSLYYGETRRREIVRIDDELREEARRMIEQMHICLRTGHTPKARRTRSCSACSLQNVCLPMLPKLPNVPAYIRGRLEDNA